MSEHRPKSKGPSATQRLQMSADHLSMAQLQGILSIADDAIICVDQSQRIILFNHGAQQIFGYSEDEALDRPLGILLPQRFRQHHPKLIEQFRGSGETARRMSSRGEIHGLRKDGREFPAEASISLLELDGARIYTVILRDISARKAHEQELQHAKEAAEAATQAKSMFLANMSHELRTPLNAVVGMTSLLLNTPIDEEQRDYTETIRGSGEALLTIINDILDYSKIELGKLEIERQPFDLRRCVEESLDLLSATAGEKNINLAYTIDDSVPAAVVSDVTRLRQILVNLLSNATKFTHRGEVLVAVTATQLDHGQHEIQFSVKDTGIGIPEDRISLLFKSFSQLDASTTRKYGGTGLGLAISNRLAEILGGRMWVESSHGVGSTFHFTIVAEASGSQRAHTFLQERSSALAGKRVLIVDDNMTNRRILVKQSLLWGMLPSAAGTPIEALDLVRHGHAFDVGILDMSMPTMDGLALAIEIRRFRDPVALPLIMLTSVAHRGRKGLTQQARFAAYLNKPIKPTALFEVLLQAMRIAKEEEPARSPPARHSDDQTPLKILVAEDNRVNQKVVQQRLAHLGHRADVVANGIEALEALDRQGYDIILMDVQMPEMDGLEAARRIRARFGGDGGPRIVAMTANAMAGDREACLKAGMNDYVAKPIELDALSAVLTRHRPPGSVVATALDAALPVIDRYRLDQLRALQDDDSPSLVAEVIEIFLKDSPKHLDSIAEAVAQASPEALKTSAHRLLSSIENLGAARMREHCLVLEMLGKAGSVEGSAARLAGLREEYAAARDELLALVNTAS